MSVKCSTWAWGLAISNSSRKLVLLALADRANDDGECWLGMASLEAKCSMPRRTVIRALADLEAAGLIGVERRAGHGSGRLPNVYRLDLTGELQKAKRQFGTPQSATTTPPKCQPDTRQSANLTLGKVPNHDEAKCQPDTRQSAKFAGQSAMVAPNTLKASKELSGGGNKHLVKTRETGVLRESGVTRARKNPSAPIPESWQPGAQAFAILESNGIPKAFAETCIAEFVLYWTERGDARPGWDASFVNSVKRDWTRRPIQAPLPGGGRTPATGSVRHERLAAKNGSALSEWLGLSPDPASISPALEIAHAAA